MPGTQEKYLNKKHSLISKYIIFLPFSVLCVKSFYILNQFRTIFLKFWNDGLMGKSLEEYLERAGGARGECGIEAFVSKKLIEERV